MSRARLPLLLALALLAGPPDAAALERPHLATVAPGPAWLERFWWLLPSQLLVEAPPAQTVRACDLVLLRGAVRARHARAIAWTATDGTLLSSEPDGRAGLRLRAPSVVVTSRVRLTLEAEVPGRGRFLAETELTVEPRPRLDGLAADMAPDCTPFEHGVASGDPHADGVVLWTRLTPSPGASDALVRWEIATDPSFRTVLQRGAQIAAAQRDFSVKIDVAGLPAGSIFYYRFRAPDGRLSPTGRTRTAPSGPTLHARFAVASCSSVYSGWFNAYRRIAAQPDLHLVIHLGDYVYDFVDPDEQVRVPSPFLLEPADLAGWRNLHAYTLHDPDLRAARAMHPWLLVWDNHDVDRAEPDYAGSVQAFREWNPLRDPDPARPEVVYRSAQWGDLVDVLLLDTLLFRTDDVEPGTSEKSILGLEQFDWLEGELAASRASWRLLGSQKLFSTIQVNPRVPLILDGEERPVFDRGAWDGFPASRSRLLRFLANRGIGDNVVISGDSHISIAADLVDDPTNPADPYDPASGEGAVGVELLPTSISRGNFDEQIRAVGFDPAQTQGLVNFLLNDTIARNPHHFYAELTQHGYGILDFTPERLEAEIHRVPILSRSEADDVAVTLTAPRGHQRWLRP